MSYKKIYTGKNPEKTIIQEGYKKVDPSQIECRKGVCVYRSTQTGKQLAMMSGFSTTTNYEFLDFDPVRQEIETSIQNCDFSSLPDVNLKAISPYVDKDIIKRRFTETDSKKCLTDLKSVVDKMELKNFDTLFASRMAEFNFFEDYSLAKDSDLKVKKDFLKKYKIHAPGQNACYKVTANSLNIRKSSSTKSKKIGTYKKNDTVCVVDRKGNWVKTQKGWVSSGYLKRSGSNQYNELYIKIETQADNSDYIIAKNRNTVASYRKYIAEHPNGLNKSDAYKNLVERLRSLQTVEGYTEAYQYSHDTSDLQKILDSTNTVSGLEAFISKHQDKKVSAKAKKKLVSLYRAKNTFSGYLSAYKLLFELDDAQKALSKAKSSHEKALVEKEIFGLYKEDLIVSKISDMSVTYDTSGRGGGFFTRHSFSGMARPRGRISVKLRDDAPFQPAFGIYKVEVTVQAVVPLYFQRRSQWLGNIDKNKESSKTKVVTFIMKPPYERLESEFDIGKTGLVFFERGDGGGYTAQWPRDDMYLSVKSINVNYVSENTEAMDIPGDLHVDFTAKPKMNALKNHEKKFIKGSYQKGSDFISKFDQLDQQKNKRYNSYASGSSDSSANSSTSTSSPSKKASSSSSSRSQNSSGVKEVYNGGYKSSEGYPIYIIKCKQGSKFNAFQRPNGYWYDGSGSNYGDHYRRLSLDAFAAKKCNY